MKVKVMTLTMAGKVRVVMAGNHDWCATLSITRSWSVHTYLARHERPSRRKCWTAKRDLRRRLDRKARFDAAKAKTQAS